MLLQYVEGLSYREIARVAVSGRVLGDPPASLEIIATPVRGAIVYLIGKYRGDGTFRGAGLAPGPRLLHVRILGKTTVQRTVDAGTSGIEIAVRR